MNQLDRLRDITTFIFDVDGVLTNAEVLVTEQGELLRTMNVRDGYAMKIALEQGYSIAIITGGRSSGVVIRLRNLGITAIYTGISDKLSVYEDLLEEFQWKPEEILYMGDDVPDHPVMRKVGVAACPADAIPEILQICQYIATAPGGKGCVREIIEKTLRIQSKWPVDYLLEKPAES